MSKAPTLFERARKVANHYAILEPPAARVIRELLKTAEEKDRELREWREGRAHKALQRENESLTAANAHLLVMLKQAREAAND